MTLAFVFPGQGSQAVGMGSALAQAFAPARAIFAEPMCIVGKLRGSAHKRVVAQSACNSMIFRSRPVRIDL